MGKIENINIHIINNKTDISVKKGTTLLEISKIYNNDMHKRLLLAKLDNVERGLNYEVKNDCVVEFLDITSSFGFLVYQRSATFIMMAAIAKVLGDDAVTWVEHSLNYNLYCNIENVSITDNLLNEINTEMRNIINAKLPIEKMVVSVNEGIKLLNTKKLIHRKKSLNFVKSSNITIYKLGDYYDYFYGIMVPDASYIEIFALHKHGDGFMLQFEDKSNPNNLSQYKAYPKLTGVFKEYKNWIKILGVHTVGSLNESICNGNIKDLVLLSEALHEKNIAKIADKIYSEGKKIVLIAGPSSSGKTTFSNRLSIQLKVLGLKPSIISLDDYYKNRNEIAVDENGQQDFENIDSLDVERFNNDLLNLINGDTVETALFDFVTGMRKSKGKLIKLEDKGILVIEGIHGINEELTHKIPKDEKFKIYISPLTQLNIDEHNRISTVDTRLLRRIVRDHYFRGFGARVTIDMWNKVLNGERKNIFPYQEEADVMFNSALIYELGILKIYAEPLLFSIDNTENGYTEAKRLLNFLNSFIAIPPESVPMNSLLREFIGGSCF